jgi:hypothetical protein
VSVQALGNMRPLSLPPITASLEAIFATAALRTFHESHGGEGGGRRLGLRKELVPEHPVLYLEAGVGVVEGICQYALLAHLFCMDRGRRR